MKFVEKLIKKSKDPICKSPIKAVFLGDSVTHGCFELYEKPTGDIDTVFDQEAVYHNQFKKIMEGYFPNAPVNIINAGISGGTVKQGAERLQRDVIDCNPDLVVICFGLNDVLYGIGALEVYRESLKSMFLELNRLKIDTVFMTPNMMNTYVSKSLLNDKIVEMARETATAQLGGNMDKYMQAAREVCKEHKIIVCDCYAKWKALYSLGADVTLLLSNQLNHPTREMHLLFAQTLFDTIIFDKKQEGEFQ